MKNIQVDFTKEEVKMILDLIELVQDQCSPWMQEEDELEIVHSIEKKLGKK